MKEVSKPERLQLYIQASSLVSRHGKGKNRILEQFCREISTRGSHLIWKEHSRTILKKKNLTFLITCCKINLNSPLFGTGFFHIFEVISARICV